MGSTTTSDVSEKLTTNGSTLAPTRFEDGDAMALAGLTQRYTFDNVGNIPAQWARFAPHSGSVPAPVGQADYGVIVTTPDGTGLDYMTAFAVSDTSRLPAEFFTLDLPAQRYAVFPHPGTVATMCETIDAAFKWLTASGYEAAGSPD